MWARGCQRVAGVDEAGRGPLAGPVVAVAVVFHPAFVEQEEHGLFATLTDSKKLTESQRNRFFDLLFDSPHVEIGIGFGAVAEIDEINILRSTHRTMNRALCRLPSLPQHAIIDGVPVPDLPCPSTAIIHGDGQSLSIAAASVIAKVTRDQWMIDLDREHPEYGFKRHKGYGTAIHIQALLKYGAIPQHRRSFRPVRDIEAIRGRMNRSTGCTHPIDPFRIES
ncbi:MAG: ribonuclease HII [Verrucomicrobia bacterium]|nr:ribonuclease HII [Verrucomicrobiota bacterium]MBU4290348.1 ribonuclease HII [Verrucomicrobiota bacterium]MBU4430192.1 ribonuclease HII [Verrucomicrobiota bacterium]